MKKIVIIIALFLIFMSTAGCTETICANECNGVNKLQHNPFCPPCPETISIPVNITPTLAEK